MKPAPWDPPVEEKRPVTAAGVARLVLVVVMLGAVAAGAVLVLGKDPAPSSCSQAAAEHFAAAETATTPEDRHGHAQLAEAYQIRDAMGDSCTWWTP